MGTFPNGGSSEAFAINSSGQVVGFAYTRRGNRHPFIWSSATGMQDLEAASAPDYATATAISSIGQVVGYSIYSGPFLWSSNGGMQPIGMSPNGINASGQSLDTTNCRTGTMLPYGQGRQGLVAIRHSRRRVVWVRVGNWSMHLRSTMQAGLSVRAPTPPASPRGFF